MFSALRWYHWFAAAAVLFAIGVAALIVLGDEEPGTRESDIWLVDLVRRPTKATGAKHTLAYSAWLFSWLGAIVSIGMGIARIRRK